MLRNLRLNFFVAAFVTRLLFMFALALATASYAGNGDADMRGGNSLKQLRR
jgi:hypothetical protein